MTNQPTNQPEKAPVSPATSANKPTGSQDAADFFASVEQTQAERNNQEVLVRKRKRKRAKHKKLRVAAIVVVALVAVGGAAAWGITSSIRAGEAALTDSIKTAEVETTETAVTYDEGKTVTYNGHTYKLNENMVSVLVAGVDRTTMADTGEMAGQADAVMVLAFDTATGKTTAIGVPRDSMVDVGEFVGDAFLGIDQLQLCLAYGYGDGKETSCNYITTAVSRTLYNIPIDYYFALDMSGIGAINDSIGGVALTPLQSIPGTNITEGQDTVLFDNNALRYVQWRDTSVLTSSLDRQARQVQYVKAFAAQALQQAKGSAGTFIDLFNAATPYAVTNLGLNEFSYLATAAVSSGISDLDVITLSGEMKQGEKFAEYYLDRTAVYETVLNVYYQQVD